MIPDLPDETLDEELVGAIEAHAKDAKFVRHDPGAFEVVGLDARSERTAGEWAADRVLWVARQKNGVFVLYLFETADSRLLRRRVEVEGDDPAVAVEVLANIAGTIVAEAGGKHVVAMTEVAPEELAPPPPPPPEPEPQPDLQPAPEPPPPEPDTWARIWLSVFYAGNTFADAPVWQNGVGLAMAWAPVRGAFVGARYDVVFPSELQAGPVLFDIRRHPVAVFGGYRFQVARRVDIQVAGKLHIDPVTRRTDDASGVPTTDDALRIYSGGGATVGIGYRPIKQVRLAIDVGADALFTRAPYGVGPDPTIVLQPHPARFTVEVGMHFGLLWRGREED
jgi:hypothetical protein